MGCVQARDLADKALASFVIIQAALKRSKRLHLYTLREDLNKRMPNFQVRVIVNILLTCYLPANSYTGECEKNVHLLVLP